jgi:HSP20 family protein
MSIKKKKIKEDDEKRIEKWTPYDVIQSFEDMLDDFRTELSIPWWSSNIWDRPWKMIPLMRREAYIDLIDNGDEFQVLVEVPGIPKDNINLTVTNNSIEISTKTKVEKDDEKGFIVKERRYTEIYRKQSFPEEVVPEEAEASVKNGVLEIIIPKKTPTPVMRKHTLEIK